MGMRVLKCPCCGASVSFGEESRLAKCSKCGNALEYDDGVLRKFVHNIHEERYVDEAAVMRSQVEIHKINVEHKELLWTMLLLIGLILALVGIPSIIQGIRSAANPDVRPPVESSSAYVGENYTIVSNALSDAGFRDVESIPVYDLLVDESDKINTVERVTIDGDLDWVEGGLISKRKNTYKANDKVRIYYHLMPENPPVKAPENSSNAYKNKLKDDVLHTLENKGFANIQTEVIKDLDLAKKNDVGKVEKVTISGDSEWTENGQRKVYHVEDEVVVYYHAIADNAALEAPQGNADAYKGQPYQLVVSALHSAGFENVVAVALNDLEKDQSDLLDTVANVTINEESDWSYGLFGAMRKTYHTEDQVIVFYHSSR